MQFLNFLEGTLKNFLKEIVRCWWLMPIILATWEAKIGRIVVQGHNDS
jgi:hypothetical protein